MLSKETKEEVNATFVIANNSAIKLQVYGHDVVTRGYSLTTSHVIGRPEEFGNFSIAIANDLGAIAIPFEVYAEGKFKIEQTIT